MQTIIAHPYYILILLCRNSTGLIAFSFAQVLFHNASLTIVIVEKFNNHPTSEDDSFFSSIFYSSALLPPFTTFASTTNFFLKAEHTRAFSKVKTSVGFLSQNQEAGVYVISNSFQFHFLKWPFLPLFSSNWFHCGAPSLSSGVVTDLIDRAALTMHSGHSEAGHLGLLSQTRLVKKFMQPPPFPPVII